MTFDLEKNEVRTFSVGDSIGFNAHQSIKPILKRKRESTRFASAEQARVSTSSVDDLAVLEHLLNLEVSIKVLESNFECLFTRMQSTVQILNEVK